MKFFQVNLITIVFLAGITVLAACKKEAVAADPAPVKAPVIYKYKMDIMALTDSLASKDTLIVKINDKTVINAVAKKIPEYTPNVAISTGDRLYIRFNPGQVYFPHYNPATRQNEDYITGLNALEVLFTGGYKNPHIKFDCRCVGTYSKVISE